MPKRTDINSILIIGAGPIVIGQACEFDYSGTQACKALKEEGYEVILINSNPATIMTDPNFADKTYIEPVTPEFVEMIIKKDRPDALLPTMGGQTGLNTALSVADKGILDEYNVEMIGADINSIRKAENRQLFKEAMLKIGQKVPLSDNAKSVEEAWKITKQTGFPAIIRPSFTLGGSGGSIALSEKEFEPLVTSALKISPNNEVLIEKSLIGWKEYELEVMRDHRDNVVIVCSIENLDPMGIHTGDSITVAPIQTLTDREYQLMRNAAIDIIREIGVDTGGSNIQFALNPKSGEMIVIEMNPRVSRSSALASKATGFPIAKIAAKLSVGYTLNEIKNDITQVTPASFEPTIDYCVVKIPRFTFEKFYVTDPVLSTQMKSVGEVMAIGRTFKESFNKALRSLEINIFGLDKDFQYTLAKSNLNTCNTRDIIKNSLKKNFWDRLWCIASAIRHGFTIEEISELTYIDPWFLTNIKELIDIENKILLSKNIEGLSDQLLKEAKKVGSSDIYIAKLINCKSKDIAHKRALAKIKPVYKRVDTCGAEFEAHTPYLYSTYEDECESNPTNKNKIMILGGGPNRIGQGIEFDYCCVHAAFSLKDAGFETIMINCNPETVSTDYDTSDRLYFEPLTFEDISHIVDVEKPIGVIVQFGGQTPLKLALSLIEAGIPIIGTSPNNIDRAEDREKFTKVLNTLKLKQPINGTATSYKEAKIIAKKIGYPVVVRPSYVLGGRAMEIVYTQERLEYYMNHAVKASPEHPILIDEFLENAIEIDVDAISDGKDVIIGGIMEHIEEAGIHSGDSACSLPTFSIKPEIISSIKEQTCKLARELNVIGLINIQFAVKGNDVFILEVNPRASRTIPFVSKATGIPLAKLAALVMSGKTLKKLGIVKDLCVSHFSIKESVFPFNKFENVDTLLGPEMKSTGEVMGIDKSFGMAFAKAQLSTGVQFKDKGSVFISVKDTDKLNALKIANEFLLLGYDVIATKGTAQYFKTNSLTVTRINKVKEGSPHIVEIIKAGKIQYVVNTTFGEQSIKDSYSLRRASLTSNIPYYTTIAGSFALIKALQSLQQSNKNIVSLQDYALLSSNKL